jgi:hypothetical protein
MYNGYEVAGYAGNFVSSNDLFTPLAAGTNRKSEAQLGIHAATGGVNDQVQPPLLAVGCNALVQVSRYAAGFISILLIS